MDQVRVILGYVKKYHFWLVCAVCLGVGLFAWMKASGNLSSQFSARKSAITGKFQDLRSIMSEAVFPNPQWKEGTDKLTEEQKKKVRAAWKLVYDEQAQSLKWPDYLGEGFLNFVKTAPWKAELPVKYCQDCMNLNLIDREFVKLRAIVGAQSDTAEQRTAGPMVQENVVWDQANKADFRVGKWQTTPSSLEVWLTQENLWVYQTLLTIIKHVNADSILPPVKEIQKLLIGKEAAKEFQDGMASGRIDRPSGLEAQAVQGGDGGDVMGGEVEEGGGGPSEEAGRYVDANGNPLAGGPEAGAAFRRMPVFLQLKIDQRHIPRLLTECANAPLPVEVRQLRVYSLREDPGGSSDRSKSRSQGIDGASGPKPSTDGAAAPYDVLIQLAGIIYIYNPPDTERLGTDEPGTVVPATAPGG